MNRVADLPVTLDAGEFLKRLVTELELDDPESVTLDSRLVEDLGFDSLQMVETIVVLAEMLGEPLDAYHDGDVLDALGTVRDLHNYYLTRSSMPRDDASSRGGDGGASLRGNLVELRPAMGNHYARLYEIAVTDEIAWRWRYGGAIPSYDEFLKGFSHGVLSQLVVTRPSSSEAIGLAVLYGANLQSSTAYLAVVVTPELVGSGVGAEAAILFLRYAFRTWNLVKVYLEFPEFNLPQFRSGLGRYFHLEGRLKAHYYHDGRRWDQLICAIYRGDIDRREIGSHRAEQTTTEDRVDTVESLIET